jgi:hypothetical protein
MPAPAPDPPVEQQPTPAPAPVRRQTRRRRDRNPVVPAASSSHQEENEIAIELASKELKKELKKGRELKRAELYDLVFDLGDKRALWLRNKTWGTHWTFSRFRQKVWKEARARVGLDERSPRGRRPDK